MDCLSVCDEQMLIFIFASGCSVLCRTLCPPQCLKNVNYCSGLELISACKKQTKYWTLSTHLPDLSSQIPFTILTWNFETSLINPENTHSGDIEQNHRCIYHAVPTNLTTTTIASSDLYSLQHALCRHIKLQYFLFLPWNLLFIDHISATLVELILNEKTSLICKPIKIFFSPQKIVWYNLEVKFSRLMIRNRLCSDYCLQKTISRCTRRWSHKDTNKETQSIAGWLLLWESMLELQIELLYLQRISASIHWPLLYCDSQYWAICQP